MDSGVINVNSSYSLSWLQKGNYFTLLINQFNIDLSIEC